MKIAAPPDDLAYRYARYNKFEENTESRDRALKVVLVILGSRFAAGIHPVTVILWERGQSGFTDATMLNL